MRFPLDQVDAARGVADTAEMPLAGDDDVHATRVLWDPADAAQSWFLQRPREARLFTRLSVSNRENWRCGVGEANDMVIWTAVLR